ncbi:DUF2141 domain-containing protein [Aquimarina sp. D1M17]|uniref:DUF2141 domain-containing protein n=1 Tax=Aquimarina acroporae TaxID=2937283 RepID=UPI0020BE8E6C|nr:DUF2141 domain-containing protein [Aquimarina acroporae]MCK8522890.1 DUF2141 domain-containing protein [Aquimarina acroporae]
MKTILTTCLMLIISSASIFSQDVTQSIQVNINGIKSNEGTIRVGLYTTKNSFLNKIYKGIDIEAKIDGVQVTFKNIEPGEYAISLYHDEDNNQTLNTFLKIPTEPYGTSNNAKGKFGPPKWEDARFIVSDQTVVQNIKL